MNIGFIGIGNMGFLMAKNLLKAGHTVAAYDIDAAASERIVQEGARFATSGKDVAKGAEAIVLILPETKDTRSVLFGQDGAAEALSAGAVVVDMGTGSPTMCREIAAELAKKGIGFIDAPVSGGVAKAASGTLSIMASGGKRDYERMLPVLRAMGEEIFHVGDVGAGQTIKLINNMLTGINLAGVCEGMVLGMKAGVDPDLLLNIINTSSGASYSSQVKIRNFVMKRAFEGGFKARLQHKDMNLATTLARELGLPVPVGTLAQQYYLAAMADGRGEEDASVIVTLLERLAGVTVEKA